MGKKSTKKPTKAPTPPTPPKKKLPEVVVEDEDEEVLPEDLDAEEEDIVSESNPDGANESPQASDDEFLSEGEVERQLVDILGKDTKIQHVREIALKLASMPANGETEKGIQPSVHKNKQQKEKSKEKQMQIVQEPIPEEQPEGPVVGDNGVQDSEAPAKTEKGKGKPSYACFFRQNRKENQGL